MTFLNRLLKWSATLHRRPGTCANLRCQCVPRVEQLEARRVLAASYAEFQSNDLTDVPIQDERAADLWPLFAPANLESGGEDFSTVNRPPDLDWNATDALYVPRETVVDTAGSMAQELTGQATQHQLPYGATSEDTSEYLLGEVRVTVVLLESDGSIDVESESWTNSEINRVKSEILEGLEWWEDTLLSAPAAPPVHDLNFQVDFTYADNPIQTGYEPIRRPQSDQGLWIGDFLDEVGYESSESYFSNVTNWNNDGRLANQTDWSFTMFVVDSSSDYDGKFSNGYFAYAYLGGPFLVMTYDNNGWGIGRMGQVLAHETGHIFYALDEYPGSRPYGGRAGYYNTQNLNAIDGHPNPADRVASIMAESSLQGVAYANHTSSPSSLEMIGWQDLDLDGIFDVLDVAPTLTGSGEYNSDLDQYEFLGASSVQTVPNQNPYGLQHSITINRVDRIQYRLDGGPWTDGNQYQSPQANIAQVIPASPGEHTIEIRALSEASGLTSPVWSDTFASLPKGYVGDMDLDGDVDFEDIEGFALGLVDPDEYEAKYGVPPALYGDTDNDGDFDFDDISSFVVILEAPDRAATAGWTTIGSSLSAGFHGGGLRNSKEAAASRVGARSWKA